MPPLESFVAQRRPQRARLHAESCLVERAPEKEGQLVDRKGLGQIVVGAFSDGLNRRFDGGVRRHDKHRPFRRSGAGPLEQSEAVDRWHAKVRDEGVHRVSFQLLGRDDAGSARRCVVAALSQAISERFSQVYVVIDDEDARLHVPVNLTRRGAMAKDRLAWGPR